MCGIAGILDFGSSEPSNDLNEQLRRMLNKIQHRGPDDHGEEQMRTDSGLRMFLGHKRLSIIEPGPAGHQPMSNNDSTIWISTNSEIYNYQELREELKPKHVFNTKTDTEVLLKSYETWGIDCLEKLRGMFAFAIWDSKNNRLILARDRLGIKPLYYYYEKNLLIFSSELRAILATKAITPNISETGIFQYLSFGRLGSPETIIDKIYELAPGNFLIADKNGLKIKNYWDPINNKEPYNPNIPVTEQLKVRLEEAVRYRLISDVPLGAFLSGGIDSSAIVGMMVDNTTNLVNTLSITFKEKLYDESNFSNLIASELGTLHNEIQLSESDLIKMLPNALDSMDQPTIDGINTFIISQGASQQGLKVALSGLGGDELFGGYETFNIIFILNRFNKIMGALPYYLRQQLGNLLSQLLNTSDKTTKLVHLVKGQLSGAHVYFLIRTLFCTEGITDLFNDKSIKEKEILKNIKSTQNLIDSKPNLSLTDLTSYLELTHYTSPTLLRDTDMMSMANGLEVRVPLLDHKLIELIFSIPTIIKDKQNPPKSLLLNSLNRPLPKTLSERKKKGFTLPFEYWMRGKMKPEIESVLLTPSRYLSDHISENSIKKIWYNFLENKSSWSRPWSLYVLKKWAEKNL